MSLARFVEPAVTPMFADAYGANNTAQSLAFLLPAGAAPYFQGRQLNSTTNWASGWGGNSSGCINAHAHNGGANYAFMDGHVKWMHGVTNTLGTTNNGCVTTDNIIPPNLGLDYEGTGTQGTGTTYK